MLTYSINILQWHSEDSTVHPFLKWTCTHSLAARISVSNWDVYLDEVVCRSQNITGCMNMGQNTSYIPVISLSLSLFLSLSLPCEIDGRETDYYTLLAHIPTFPSF